MERKIEWSFSKLATLRRCHRQFYFAYEIAHHSFKYPIRRKAFELGQAKSLRMWQGSLIDDFFTKKIIPLYKEKEIPDFQELADEILDLASEQFSFSESRLYRQQGMTKTKAGEKFLVLDIHECGVPYKESDVYEVYSNIERIILGIPNYPSPESGKTLHEYLMAATYLQADVRYYSYEFEGVRIKPQIDLIRHGHKSVHVIDWKVSDSDSSDYSKQLVLEGIVAFHSIKSSNKQKNLPLPKLENVSLFEVNMMNGNIKQHYFSKESAAAALNYVFQYRDEQEFLSEGKDWKELNIEDYGTTDNRATCLGCKYKALCVFLIKNNNHYDDEQYNKLVSDRQLV